MSERRVVVCVPWELRPEGVNHAQRLCDTCDMPVTVQAENVKALEKDGVPEYICLACALSDPPMPSQVRAMVDGKDMTLTEGLAAVRERLKRGQQ